MHYLNHRRAYNNNTELCSCLIVCTDNETNWCIQSTRAFSRLILIVHSHNDMYTEVQYKYVISTIYYNKLIFLLPIVYQRNTRKTRIRYTRVMFKKNQENTKLNRCTIRTLLFTVNNPLSSCVQRSPHLFKFCIHGRGNYNWVYGQNRDDIQRRFHKIILHFSVRVLYCVKTLTVAYVNVFVGLSYGFFFRIFVQLFDTKRKRKKWKNKHFSFSAAVVVCSRLYIYDYNMSI